MKIAELYRQKNPVLSFEVFPPKYGAPADGVLNTLSKLACLQPDFISVTYGAGGSGAGRTAEYSGMIRNQLGLEALAHLTCTGMRRTDIDAVLPALRDAGVENILALRGDKPKDGECGSDYAYASDLICHIKAAGGFCVGAAAYCEGHVEKDTLEEDLVYIKGKAECGADFFITQLFFDNIHFYNLREGLAAIGVHAPVSAGVMPILDAQQILRMTMLSGCTVPRPLSRIVALYADKPAEFARAGLDHAAGQIQDLLKNGAEGIHLYTMNKWQQAQDIVRACGLR